LLCGGWESKKILNIRFSSVFLVYRKTEEKEYSVCTRSPWERKKKELMLIRGAPVRRSTWAGSSSPVQVLPGSTYTVLLPGKEV
jgi:hypothetical protein